SSRNAFTCASVQSSHRITGTSAKPSLAGSLEPEVTVDHVAGAAREHRYLEAELADRRGHAIDGVIIFPGVPGVRDETAERPLLDLLRYRMRQHTRSSRRLILEEPFGGCALRWPGEPSLYW